MVDFTNKGIVVHDDVTGGINKVTTEDVVADGLQDDQITNALLENMVESTIKGRAAGAGTGNPTDLTAAQVLTLLGVLASSSGTYTPTTTALVNCDAVTGYTSFYIRIGNYVIVFFLLTVDATTAGTITTFQFSLPIPSNFTSSNDALGIMVQTSSANAVGSLSANTTSDVFSCGLISAVTANATVRGIAIYEVK